MKLLGSDEEEEDKGEEEEADTDEVVGDCEGVFSDSETAFLSDNGGDVELRRLRTDDPVLCAELFPREFAFEFEFEFEFAFTFVFVLVRAFAFVFAFVFVLEFEFVFVFGVEPENPLCCSLPSTQARNIFVGGAMVNL